MPYRIRTFKDRYDDQLNLHREHSVTTRFCLAATFALSPALNLFAHDSDHTGMADLVVTLHHAAPSFAAAVLVVAIIVIA